MRTEITLTIIFLLGLILHFSGVTGGSLIILIALSLLSLLYFPFAFYFFSDKSIKRQNLALSIIAGLFLFVIPNGILFKLLHWPGGVQMLMVSIPSTLILLIVTFSLKTKAAEELKTYYKNLFMRTAVLLILGLFFYLIPSKTLIDIQHSDNPELARLKNNAYSNPDNEEYRDKLNHYMDSMIHAQK